MVNLTREAAQEIARVLEEASWHLPDGSKLDHAAEAVLKTLTAALAQSSAPQARELTDENVLALAHRTATTYAHRSDPKYHSYSFVPHTLLDFARALLAKQKELK